MITGFHLSGVVWTYPPTSGAIVAPDTTNDNSYGINHNGHNGNPQHQQQPPGRGERINGDGSAANSNNGYQPEVNKKFHVSVSFDR